MPFDLRERFNVARPQVKPAAMPRRGWHTRSDALLAAAIILPLIILGACAWVAWNNAWRSAERELASDADAVAEYSSRVIESHRLAGVLTNHMLRGLSDDAIRAQAGPLYRQFNALLGSLAGVSTIAVLDRDAGLLMLANLFPIPPGTRTPDREWVRALAAPDAPAVHISQVATGVLDGSLFFAVSQRRTGTGNGLPVGAYDGVITVSVDPRALSAGLANLRGEVGNVAALVRSDGAVLARSTGMAGPLPPIAEDSPLRAAARDGTVRGSYMGRSLGVAQGQGARGARLIAFRRVGDLPLYATAARPSPLIVANWRDVVIAQLAVGVPAWLALIALAWMLRRGQRALALANAQLEQRVEEGTAALRMGEAQMRLAQRAARIGTWMVDPETGEVVWSDEQYALFGMTQAADGTMTFARFLDEVVHPDDRALVQSGAEAALTSGEYDGDFRIWQRMPDGTRRMRWVTGRGRRMPGPDGRARILGVNVDITERKDSEERQQLLMREVDHRAKNVLAVVLATLRLTPRHDADAYARAVEGRVAALARAHVLLAERHWTGASLRDLVRAEVAIQHPGGDATALAAMPRVQAEGPEVTLAPPAAQALSMTLHELATNAIKYGALSVASGRVSVTWRVDAVAQSLDLRWQETGGPRIAQPPERRGFGSRVVEAAIRDQLGGKVERDWRKEGLALVATLPLRVLTEAA